MIVLFQHVAMLLLTAAHFARRGFERWIFRFAIIATVLFHAIWCLCVPHVEKAMSPQLLDLHLVPMLLLFLFQLESLRADPLRV